MVVEYERRIRGMMYSCTEREGSSNSAVLDLMYSNIVFDAHRV